MRHGAHDFIKLTRVLCRTIFCKHKVCTEHYSAQEITTIDTIYMWSSI